MAATRRLAAILPPMWRDIGTWPNGSLTCSVKTGNTGAAAPPCDRQHMRRDGGTDHCHWRVVTQASDKASPSTEMSATTLIAQSLVASRPLIVVLPLVR